MRKCWLAILVVCFFGCGTTEVGDEPDAGTGGILDSGAQVDVAPPEPATAHIRGVVYAPNGTSMTPPLTVMNALVYVSDFPPSPIPNEVYCEHCTEVPSGAVWVKTDAFGAFDINVWEGSYVLVIQKGQFRLVRSVIVGKDQVLDVPASDTTLPSANSPDGNDTIPRIALLSGSFDELEGLFAKLGLAGLSSDGQGIEWGPDTQFDVYDNGGDVGDTGAAYYKGDAYDLLTDFEKMKQYHIIFVPCSSTASDIVTDSTVQENLRQYVRAGGKFYVADWSYDYLRQTWDLVHFDGDDGATPGSANTASFGYAPFDSHGHAVDTDLFDWLEAQQGGWGGDSLVLKENWDWIVNLTEGYVGTGTEGEEMYQKPDVIVEGPHGDEGSWQTLPPSQIYPLTVGFPYGCGRVLYTTYHTVGEMSEGHAGLEVQERILVYLIMEIGVCQSGPILQ